MAPTSLFTILIGSEICESGAHEKPNIVDYSKSVISKLLRDIVIALKNRTNES